MMKQLICFLLTILCWPAHGMYRPQGFGYRPPQQTYGPDMMDMPHLMADKQAAAPPAPVNQYPYQAPFNSYQRPPYQHPSQYQQPQPESHQPRPYQFNQYQYNQPETAYNRPEPAYHAEPTYRHPEPAYRHPEPAYLQPEPAYRQPEPAYHQPEPAYHQPEPAYRQPEPSYRQPATQYRYQQPFTAYQTHKQPEPNAYHRPQIEVMDKDKGMMMSDALVASPAKAAAAVHEPKYLGTFDKARNRVEGDIFMLDDHTLYIQGFSFDGQAPDVFFWSDGVKIPYYTRSNPSIQLNVGELNREDVVLLLPPEKPTLKDLDHITIWCQKFGVNFGEFYVTNAYKA